MNRQCYFDYLQETSAKVSPVISQLVEQIKIKDTELYDIVCIFVNRRLNKPLLKPALLRLCFELCHGGDWEKIIPAAAAFELLNISSYQANAAFDNKLGIVTRSQKDSQFIASMITRELSFQAVTRLRENFDEEIIGNVQKSISNSNHYIYLAQHYDLNILTVQNMGRYQDDKVYLRDYIDRCRFGSGIFNGQCAIAGGLLAKATREQLETLRGFGESFGAALQIVNDIGDFTPPDSSDLIGRDFQDQFSDFKNGRLTLPLYHLLMLASPEASNLALEMIESFRLQNRIPCEIVELLEGNGSFAYAKEQGNRFVKDARNHLRTFGTSQARNLLLVMCSMIESNKYFVALRNFRAERVGG